MAKTRRKWSLRSACGVLLVSIGVVLAAVTIVHMATYNPEKTVTMKASGSEDAVFSYTSPGVLNIVNESPHITITASTPRDSIEWGIGSSEDVKAFVGQSAAREIKGFKNEELHTLYIDHDATGETAQNDAKAIKDGGFALDKSDMWEKSGHGKGSVSIDVELQEGVNRSLIASTTSGTAPEITLTWQEVEEVASPAPFIVIAVLLVLIGVVLLLTDWREQARKEAIGRAQDARHAHAEAKTTILPSVQKQDERSDQKTHNTEKPDQEASIAHERLSRKGRHKYSDADHADASGDEHSENSTHQAQTLWGYTEESEDTAKLENYNPSDEHPENYLNVSTQKGKSDA